MPEHEENTILAAIPPQASYRLYRDIMMLIEEANDYIHGEGRLVMRSMLPEVIDFYSKQAMQLSSRLMQTAALLLLVRAAAEGDMSVQTMQRESTKIMRDLNLSGDVSPLWGQVPEAFYRLNQKSLSLAWQAKRLGCEKAGEESYFNQGKNVVGEHLNRLKNAFSN